MPNHLTTQTLFLHKLLPLSTLSWPAMFANTFIPRKQNSAGKQALASSSNFSAVVIPLYNREKHSLITRKPPMWKSLCLFSSSLCNLLQDCVKSWMLCGNKKQINIPLYPTHENFPSLSNVESSKPEVRENHGQFQLENTRHDKQNKSEFFDVSGNEDSTWENKSCQSH